MPLSPALYLISLIYGKDLPMHLQTRTELPRLPASFPGQPTIHLPVYYSLSLQQACPKGHMDASLERGDEEDDTVLPCSFLLLESAPSPQVQRR